ncbi:MAG: UPF0182 family protein [Actinomycetota bacterium]|nr:UPF0182 family protein [Actinomycetota bacterium]
MRLIIGITLATIVVLFFIGATTYTDWLWFMKLGYGRIFITSWTYRLGVSGAFGAITFILLALNVWLAKRLSPNIHFISRRLEFERFIQQGRAYLDQYFALVGYLGSAAVALFTALSMGAFWDAWLKYFSYTGAGVKDPLFGRDIGFYFFTLPVVEIVQNYLWFVLLAALAATIVIHLIRGSFNIGQGPAAIYPKARVHLSVLVALLLGVVGLQWWLAAYRLVYSPRGLVYGAGYSDIHVLLPAYKVLIVVTGAAIALVIIYALSNRWRLPIVGAAGIALVWIVGVVVLPTVVQQFRVVPNELAKELPYISKSIASTRRAYGLDKVVQREFPAEAGLSAAVLEQNQGTIDSLRLWDWRPLQKTYKQIQEIRLYYGFQDVDLDRYTVDGRYRQLALSAREMIAGQLPQQANSWINRHLVYTHGYGAVVSPVNEVAGEGLPEFFVKNIPPQSTSKSLAIKQPQIYFGEATDDYAIVNTKTREFDYPAGDRNKYTDYNGKDGIKLDSYLTKLAFAYRFGTVDLMLSDAVTAKTRILFYRNVRQRLETLAPFLTYDPDPYMVINNGRLYWIVDAYTVTDKYPYATPSGNGQNYIRNSVKAVVDAYEGTVDFYIADTKDPIIATYAKAFPGVFKPLSKMNKGLLKHIRYPEALFKAQAELYRSFHMGDPQVFFRKEDLWDIPNEIYDNQTVAMDPYYVVMQLPGENRGLEFALILPYTPSNKSNMTAWLAARSDPPNYGQLLLYTFPKDKLVFGPMQVEARLDQDPEISRQLSLWNQRGSRVIRGNLLVVPIGKTILYVEPLYLQAESSEMPELKRIAVGIGDKVVMEPTLEQALNSLLGGKAPAPAPRTPGKPAPPATAETRQQLIQKAGDAFSKAEEAQKSGDWAEYGRQQKILKDTLLKLIQGQ